MRQIEEWTRRIEIWINELKNHHYIKLDNIEFEGFTTKENLSYQEAMKQTFRPMPTGTKWGEKWEYGWFRGTVTIPKEAKNKRIYMKPRVGEEMLVWVNGIISGSVDLKHDGITLTTEAAPGDKYEIVLECYAGHGPRLENGGPYSPEVIPVPQPPKYQVVVEDSDFGIWNEEAFLLSMDSEVLFQLYQTLDKKSLRAQKIRNGLKEFTKIADFEIPLVERNKTYIEARKVLKPLLECINGSTAPMYTIFGQSHLDLAWKWTWNETRRKSARTLSTQIGIADEYPEYKFLLCEPPIMESVKRDYPELYERVKEKVDNGQFIPEGGVWVEPDTNIPSGESLIRQFTWGKRWFKNEYDVDVKMVWLPDCFGFTGQLPQIMKGCGIEYFATQKIARALKGSDVFPYNIFMWQGIDGSQILTHFFKKNNAQYDPINLTERWNSDRVQQEDIDSFMFPFGFGDGGGGPVREMLEMTRRTKDLEGLPRTKMESPINFFENIEEKGLPDNTYVGELYLPWHQGSLTAQAKTKQGNRKGELILRELEFWSSLSGLDNGTDIYKENEDQIKEIWDRLLFNQFHDILAGTSIGKVHEEAEKDYEFIIERSNKIIRKAIDSIIMNSNLSKTENHKAQGLTLFNSLSWDRVDYIELPASVRQVYDYDSQEMDIQKTKDKTIVKVELPSCGHTTIYPIYDQLAENTLDNSLEEARDLKDNSANRSDMNIVHNNNTNIKDNKIVEVKYSDKDTSNPSWIMENDCLKVIINEYGQITSIFDKEENFEYAAGICNELCMYKDVNIDYDAWEMSSFHEELPIDLSEKAEIKIKSSGPLVGQLSIKRKLNNSTIRQDIILKSGSRRVDFPTLVDWKESHKLLKVKYPVNVLAEESIEEIQFGYIKRPTHKSRPHDSDRFEICNHKYTALAEANRTFGVLNDSKYGVSTLDNCISLSLLRAPLIPDMYADKGKHEFTYSFYAYNGSFENSNIIREGYELNIPTIQKQGEAIEKSYFRVSDPSVIIETLKPAEDDSGDLILRLYEGKKGHSVSTLETCFDIIEVSESNMLEEKLVNGNLNIRKDKDKNIIKLNFRPFEIKTLRLKL